MKGRKLSWLMLNKAETKEFNLTDACQKRIDEIDPAEDLKI